VGEKEKTREGNKKVKGEQEMGSDYHLRIKKRGQEAANKSKWGGMREYGKKPNWRHFPKRCQGECKNILGKFGTKKFVRKEASWKKANWGGLSAKGRGMGDRIFGEIKLKTNRPKRRSS